MPLDDNLSALFSILLTYDASWYIVYIWYDEAIISNSIGQEIHAGTLESALHAALSLYGGT